MNQQQAYNLYYQQLYKLYWQMLWMQYLQALTQPQQGNHNNQKIADAANPSKQYYQIHQTDSQSSFPKLGNRNESQYFLDKLDYPPRRIVSLFNAVENSSYQKRLVRSRYTKLRKVAHIIQDTRASNLITDYVFDKDRGFMTDIISNSLSKNIWYNYAYDKLGNLRKRADINQNLSECFYYDNLNRMTNSSRYNNFGINCGNSPVAGHTELKNISYDGKGNITQKDNQTYSYQNANANTIGNSPHQVQTKGNQVFTYDSLGNNIKMTNFQTANGSFIDRNISYTTFNKVDRLYLGNDPNNPQSEAQYLYDTTRQKYARIDTENGETTVTYFIGNVEIEYNTNGQIAYKRQLGNYAIITETNNSTQETYLFTDHLGSVDTITDKSGRVLQSMSFSAWGERRLPNNWDDFTIPTVRDYLSDYTTRGFTGHEMVDAFGIINMGGRIYDAALGRVLQADPFVQDPTNTQSFNRYTYVFNNPLSYTDPSGYFSLRQALGMIIGAVIAFYTGGILGWDIFWVGFASGFASTLIITGNLKTALKAGIISGALAFAGNGFSNENPITAAANEAGQVAGGAKDAVQTTAQMEAAQQAVQAATRAAFKRLVVDIVSQIAQSIDPELGVAVSFLANTGNYSGLSAGKILRNLTSKYGNMKASQELERFARKNGMTLGELNLLLITASFLGNKIVGSRFEQEGYLNGNEDTQGIHGMFDRQNGGLIDATTTKGTQSNLNRVVGSFFDVVDVVLGYQGLITASGYDFIKNGNSDQLLYGHSLGAINANNLVSRGFASIAHLDSLPFGNVSVNGTTVHLSFIDAINGFIFGQILNPDAEMASCIHSMSCYHPGN
ncbi:hypothetical protein MNBD_GAMMA01-701 [hydrothermal vent metagenome]|uniref:Rhs-family protein n=1 Tax=hydrothermal vent metagenome TaxID=652676 RepID=A0A3B0VZP9_9ZZZZ